MSENLKTPEERQKEFDQLSDEEKDKEIKWDKAQADSLKDSVEEGHALDYNEASKLDDIFDLCEHSVGSGKLFLEGVALNCLGKDINNIEASNWTKIEEDFMQLISNARLRYTEARFVDGGHVWKRIPEDELENAKARVDINLSMIINLMKAAKENRLSEAEKVAHVVSDIDAEIENKIEDIEAKTVLRIILKRLYSSPDAHNDELSDKLLKGNYADIVNYYLKAQGIDPSLLENLAVEKWAQLIVEKTGKN